MAEIGKFALKPKVNNFLKLFFREVKLDGEILLINKILFGSEVNIH